MKKAIAFWWNYFWTMTLENPRTSMSGLFSLLAVFFTGLAALVPDRYKLVSAGVGIGSAACKLVLLCLSSDPGKQFAKFPGNGNIAVVDSHEVPDNPKAEAITAKEAVIDKSSK